MRNHRHEQLLPTVAARETFFSVETDRQNATLAIAGVPLDIEATNLAGLRDSRAAVRRASRMVGGEYSGLWKDSQIEFFQEN